MAGSKSPIMQERLITPAQLADFVQMHVRSVYRMYREGKLPEPVEVGESVRWRESDLQKFFKVKLPIIPM